MDDNTVIAIVTVTFLLVMGYLLRE